MMRVATCLISGLSLIFPLLIASPAGAENFEVMVAPLVPYKRYGAPSLVELRDGRILLAYDDWKELGDSSDASPSVITGRISEDGGRSWGRPFVMKESTSKMGRMGSSTLLRLHGGQLLWVFNSHEGHTDSPYFAQRSGDDGRTWSKPVPLTREPAYYAMNNHRVIQLRSGRLLAPFSEIPDIRKRAQYSWESSCYFSDDLGDTWHRSSSRVRMSKHPTGAQEPAVIELKDSSVMMIIRNEQERVYKAISKDSGETWSEPEAIEQLIAPVSPATVMRIPATSDLAIVWNYSPKVRTPLAVAISRDEGSTWEHIKYLESDYFSYAYTAYLFPRGGSHVLLCYWVDDRRGPLSIGLRLRGIDIDWLYAR